MCIHLVIAKTYWVESIMHGSHIYETAYLGIISTKAIAMMCIANMLLVKREERWRHHWGFVLHKNLCMQSLGINQTHVNHYEKTQ